MSAATANYVTQQDLDQAFAGLEERLASRLEIMITRIVGDVVGEIVSDALVLINARFDKIEARMDRMEGRMDSVEDKLDLSITRIDAHDVHIRQLRRKTA